MNRRGRQRILAPVIQLEPAMTTDQTVRAERRRRFVLVECPFCQEAHDALLDGGRQRTPCGREMEAKTVDGGIQARVL